MTSIHASTAPKAIGNYPHARRVGEHLFLSGIGPRTPGSNVIPGNEYDAVGALVSYDITAQCHSVFANVRAVLEAAGAQWADLVDVTVCLTDMPRDFQTYNRIWAEYFPAGQNQPTRTTIEIGALPQGGNAPIAFEVKVVATMGEANR